MFIDPEYFEIGGIQHAGGIEMREARVAIQTEEMLESRIAVILAGMAAERVVFGNHGTGAGGAESSDLAIAAGIATRMESHYGFGENLVVELGSWESSLDRTRASNSDLKAAVNRRMKKQLERMMEIMGHNRAALDAIVLKLLNDHSVSGTEIWEIVERGTDA